MTSTYCSERPRHCCLRSRQRRHTPSGCKCSGGSYTQTVTESRPYLQNQRYERGITPARLRNSAGSEVSMVRTAVFFVGTFLAVIFAVTCPAHRNAAAARTSKVG